MSDPSFTQLFRRSRYSRIGPSGDDERDQDRKEVFAVAAVGFALKHDAQFQKKFLEKFAGIDEDPEDYKPSLQPADCIDLRLENPQKKILVAVEFKVGAGLAEHQNPWLDFDERKANLRKPDDKGLPFWCKAKNGYGFQFSNDFKDFPTVHYVIVQQKEHGDVRDEEPIEQPGKTFHLKRRNWECLLPPNAGLERDLVNSLGELGITELVDWTMKTMKIDPESIEGCFKGLEVGEKLIKILLWISKKLRLTVKLDDFVTEISGDSRYLGIGFSNKVTARLSKERSAYIGKRDYGAGWFGYSSEQQGKFQPEVWFYCNDNMKPRLLNILKTEFSDSVEFPEPPKDGCENYNIRIRRSQTSRKPDGAWFYEVLGINEFSND